MGVLLNRRRLLLGAAGVSAGWASVQSSTWAQAAFPQRPLTLTVPFPAGGSTDLAVRALVEEAQSGLGQPIIVKNLPGAAGVLGAQSLLSARPDGYSLAVMPESVYRLPYLQAMSYEPLRDFSPVIQIAGYALGIAVRQDAPWRDWAALVEDAHRRPAGQISYGSTGLYSTPHMVVEEIAQRLGVEFQHVPYKGEAEIVQALLGGHIDLGLAAGATAPLVEQGRIRLLVVWTAARTPQSPAVPTLREVGLDLVATAPFGIAGPRGLAPEVVAALHAAFHRALSTPALRETLTRLHMEAAYLDTAAYALSLRTRDAALRAQLGRLGYLPKSR